MSRVGTEDEEVDAQICAELDLGERAGVVPGRGKRTDDNVFVHLQERMNRALTRSWLVKQCAKSVRSTDTVAHAESIFIPTTT
jgi:hypothetical protein